MKKKIILIVEDQSDIRKLIRMTLECGPYEVHEVDNGDAAIHMVQAFRPDLVLLDVMMPGTLDGYQVCARIKKDPQSSHTPVLMLTARGKDADLQMGEAVGANGYLTKPFSPLELIDTVSVLLKN
jgi:CheY-like chemotaxis protein